MYKKNSVFIATSLDGYIADKNGGIDWLNSVPNPENEDMGYIDFMSNIDALIMGRNTFETVLGFDMDWPYTKPVFILSNRLKQIPEHLKNKVFLVNGSLTDVLDYIHSKGFYQLYIDGGTTIQSFLKAGLIDDIILTRIPILLGGGISLFSERHKAIKLDLIGTKTYLNQITQSHYTLKK